MAAFALPTGPDGEILPHNHPDLQNGNRMIRRVSREHIVPDENLGGERISSVILRNNPKLGYLSFDSEKCIVDLNQDPVAFVQTPEWCGALVLTVEQFRSFDTAANDDDKWKIGMVPEEGNPCHGGVWGKITKGQSNDLQRAAEWLVNRPGFSGGSYL